MLDRILEQLTYNPEEPMIFSSGLFLILFLGFTFCYMLMQHTRTLRLLFVTAFSYYFYYKSSGLKVTVEDTQKMAGFLVAIG